jgi:predicted dehydrogenase
MLKRTLEESSVGRPFRARIRYVNSFPVFDNQPFLKDVRRFILMDMGSHILDVARFLFGDAHRLYCQTRRVRPGIKGEDVATVVMEMGDRVTVVCDLSYASRVEHDRFPETFIHVECENGSVELAPDYWVRVSTEERTVARRHVPRHYAWAEPAYDVVHASIVPCCAHLLAALETGGRAETSAEDNLRTMELVFGAYESADKGEVFVPSGVS